MSEAKVSSLCEAASKSGQLRSNPHHADFQRWYPSPGGKVVPPGDIGGMVSVDRPTESPPSYDDLGLSSPGPKEASAPRKMIRRSSGTHEKVPDVEKGAVSLEEATQVVDRLRDLILQAERQEALLRERMGEADQKLAQESAEDKESQLEELKQYVDDRLEQTRLELREFIDERFDDLGVDVLKSEMEDYVDEAQRTAEDDLRERLGGGGIRVIFDD